MSLGPVASGLLVGVGTGGARVQELVLGAALAAGGPGTHAAALLWIAGLAHLANAVLPGLTAAFLVAALAAQPGLRLRGPHEREPPQERHHRHARFQGEHAEAADEG